MEYPYQELLTDADELAKSGYSVVRIIKGMRTHIVSVCQCYFITYIQTVRNSHGHGMCVCIYMCVCVCVCVSI